MSDDKVRAAEDDVRGHVGTPEPVAGSQRSDSDAAPPVQAEADVEVTEPPSTPPYGDDAADDGASAEGLPDEDAAPEPEGPTDTDAPTVEADEPSTEADEPSTEADEEPAPLPPPDPRTLRIRLLERELAAREETLRDYIKAHKKAQSEFDVFKQRLLRDQEHEIAAARAKAVEPMLDVHDNLKRTLDAVRGGGSFESLQDGVELVARQFIQTLEGMGLERHDPTGETFDPATMNALAVVPVTDPALVNKVVVTIQPGFRLGDREIRPALVQVGRKA